MQIIGKANNGLLEAPLTAGARSVAFFIERGIFAVDVRGTFGGATLRMEWSPNSTDGSDGTWEDFSPDLLLTGAGTAQTWVGTADVNPRPYRGMGMGFRFYASGGDGTTSITCRADADVPGAFRIPILRT